MTTEAETAAAEAAHQVILRGIKGEIQGGRPGQRRGGSVVQEATSTGKDEGGNAPTGFWQVKPKKHTEWDISPAKPTFQSRQHLEQEAVRQQQAAEAKARHHLDLQQRLNRFRSHLATLDAKALGEALTAAYIKHLFCWPPSAEAKNDLLFVAMLAANRETLSKALETEIQKLETELARD